MPKKNKISFRIKDLSIEELDEVSKDKGFENRSKLINEAIKGLIEPKFSEKYKEYLQFFYDIFLKNADKFQLTKEEIEKVEEIEGELN